MKTLRIITAAIFAAIAIAIDILVFTQWYAQGCEAVSLIAGLAFYTACLAGLWYTIDSSIKEANNQ